MLFILQLILSFSTFTFVGTTGTDYAHHPDSKEPLYIEMNWYESLKNQIPPSPANDSAQQKEDEQTMLAKQKSRMPQDCERASTEVGINLSTFYGKPYGFLNDSQIKVLSAFFEQVRNDTSYFVLKIKKEFHRDRPYRTLADLNPCVTKETSDSYPSGHAAISQVFALTLEELFPAQKTTLEARNQQIAKDRVLAGLHYPSDIKEGSAIGKIIFLQMKNSPRFQHEMSQLKRLISN